MKLTDIEKQVLLDALRQLPIEYRDPAQVAKRLTRDGLIKMIEKMETVCPRN